MTETRHRSVPFERGSTLVVGLVVAAALALAAVWWWEGRAEQAPATPAPVVHAAASSPAPLPTGTAAPATQTAGPTAAGSAVPATVTIDIRGAVRAPGPRQLPAGSRVMDAVAAAGGLRPGRHYGPLNLARVLTDGEQIRVGRGDAWDETPTAAAAGSTGQPPTSAGLINLNTADALTLEELDGVGPVLAASIIEWRTTNGPFRSVDDLLDVSGIGDATLTGMRDQVTVG